MDISIHEYLVSFFFIDRKFKHKLNIKWKYKGCCSVDNLTPYKTQGCCSVDNLTPYKTQGCCSVDNLTPYKTQGCCSVYILDIEYCEKPEFCVFFFFNP
jgi:hypothetical protein